MSLFKKWQQLAENHTSEQEEVKFWEEYLKLEAGVYDKILNNKTEIIKGKISDLAKQYEISEEYFMGFLDGISESTKNEIKLENLESNTEITVEIDFEKLYYNMNAVEAHWLYNLEGWNDILSAEKRKELQKKYKSSKTVVNEEKIGRNDACPCNSGKKYKKCCGK
ncbi:SEC-C metal-binding domain-containing protein [Tepidibacter mesophilus]|uniref:SEC-C metal-binding domain-containing protein n=1 Tax=Tepidibacter mesophilus TaxID=655607 RepID=UPI000C06A4DC|nr:SEC-C metal-binding domain-containing protein [Tepidibacter mesophilus]